MDLRKCWPDDSDFICDRIFIRLAGNEDNHKILGVRVLGRSDYTHESSLPFSLPETYNGTNVVRTIATSVLVES